MRHHTTARSRIAHALAERDGGDMNVTRVREFLEAQADKLIVEWAKNPRQPVGDVEAICEEARQADLAAEVERHARAAERATLTVPKAAEKAPLDLDYRKLVLLDEATGRRYLVKLDCDDLETIGHNATEATHEAAGRRFVRRAATAA